MLDMARIGLVFQNCRLAAPFPMRSPSKQDVFKQVLVTMPIASLPRSVHVRQSMLTDLQLVLDFRQHPDRSCAGYSDGEMY